jgi:hypothetical protein
MWHAADPLLARTDLSGEVIQLGEWPRPPELEVHVLRADGNVRVSEVWDSRESLETYGQKVFPIMSEDGIEMASP